MPQDSVDLQKRLAAATPKDTVKGSLVNGVCLTLERIAGAEDPRVKDFVRKYRKPLWMEFTDHPVSEFLRETYEAADLVEIRFGTPERALTEIGRGAGQNFLESVVGRVAVSMVTGSKTPVDILSYAPALYGPTASYGKRWFTRLNDRQGTFHVRNDFLPAAYHMGILPTGIHLNHHQATLEAKVLGLLDADFTVTWDGQPPVKAPRVG